MSSGGSLTYALRARVVLPRLIAVGLQVEIFGKSSKSKSSSKSGDKENAAPG